MSVHVRLAIRKPVLKGAFTRIFYYMGRRFALRPHWRLHAVATAAVFACDGSRAWRIELRNE